MRPITDLDRLTEIYGDPVAASLTKVSPHLTPLYHEWIAAARFVVLSTIGPEGTDASPRGDVDPVVRIQDDRTILLPDWRGNNRIDSLRNIVRDPRTSLMFMVPGSNNVVRINGRAIVTDDPDLCQSFEQNGKHPRTVIVITTDEVYFQCAKAIMRAGLWDREAPFAQVPTAGQLIKEQQDSFDAETYDHGYPEYAKSRMW